MSTFEVSKSIEINASVSKVFNTVLDFEQGRDWSPWSQTETKHTSQITGDTKKVGAVFAWQGRRTGEGKMEHKEIIKNEYILDELRFFKPWKSTDQASWQFEKVGTRKTKVTWNMHGSLPFFLFFMKKMMIGMISENYERGLRMLKEYVETGEVLTSITEPEIVSRPSIYYVGIEAECSIDKISASMTKSFSRLMKRSAKWNVEGNPMAIYQKFDMANGYCKYIAAVPVSEDHKIPKGYVSGTLEACEAMQTTHTGKYDHIGNAWNAVMGEMRARKMKMKKGIVGVEEYPNDPETTEPKDLLAIISVPIR